MTESFGSSGGGGGTSRRRVKLHQKNQEFKGVMIADPIKGQERVYGTNEPKTWPDGNPVYQWEFQFVVLDENPCDCDEYCKGGATNASYGTPEDDGVRALFVPFSRKKYLNAAMFDAMAEAGAKEPEVGSVWSIKRTGVDHGYEGTGKPPVTFSATYAKPTSDSIKLAKAVEDKARKPKAGFGGEAGAPPTTKIRQRSTPENDPAPF